MLVASSVLPGAVVVGGALRLRRGCCAPSHTSAAARTPPQLTDAELLGERDAVARTALVGSQLWAQYSRRVRTRMQNPTHRGCITSSEAAQRHCALVVGENGAEACGDAVRLFLAVDRRSRRVLDAKFQTFGCATAIAASDAAAELCIGRTLGELAAITNTQVEAALRDTPAVPAVPAQKMHCSVMASEVIRDALRDAAKKGLMPPAAASSATTTTTTAVCGGNASSIGQLSDDVVVCECAGVTLGTIRNAIRNNGLRTVAQITQYTKAGGFCKSCVKRGGHADKQVHLLDVLRYELEHSRPQQEKPGQKERAEEAVSSVSSPQPPPPPPQKKQAAKIDLDALSPVQQAAIVQRVLDDAVVPVLRRHGGSVLLRDIKRAPVRTIELQYTGACASCALASGGTLRFITQALRQHLGDPALLVVLSTR